MNPAARASVISRRSIPGCRQAWISAIAQHSMPSARARSRAARAAASSSGSISSPSAPMRPVISTQRSCSGSGRVMARSNRFGRAWSPISSRSAKPRSSSSSTRAPRRSSRALVATVVPIRTLSISAVGIGAPARSPSDREMPVRAASSPSPRSLSSLRVESRPCGSRAMMSVNVPPRSIQNRHPARRTEVASATSRRPCGVRGDEVLQPGRADQECRHGVNLCFETWRRPADDRGCRATRVRGAGRSRDHGSVHEGCDA